MIRCGRNKHVRVLLVARDVARPWLGASMAEALRLRCCYRLSHCRCC